MKVALVCDWLTNVGGAEKVLLRIHKLFPEAPIYTSKYDPRGIDWFLDAEVKTGWLQIFPAKLRRLLGPLRQRYFAKLDLSEYDLVISVTGAEAKAVKAPNGLHVSYCHVPTQYYWQMYDEYIENPGFGIFNPVVRFFFKLMVKPLRKADLVAAGAPDYFITISEYAKDLIKKYYGREAVIVHPGVDLEEFTHTGEEREDFYVATSRQVNWKKLDIAVEAAMQAGRKLVVIGEGPEHKRLVKIAGDDKKIKFLPMMTKKKLVKYLRRARGYLFPSLEPFGIAPVEALATGCPVIAFSEGGARDYVKEGKNGVLFREQTAEALAEAILEFEKKKFDGKKVAETAEGFREERFDQELKDWIFKWQEGSEKKRGGEKEKAKKRS